MTFLVHGIGAGQMHLTAIERPKRTAIQEQIEQIATRNGIPIAVRTSGADTLVLETLGCGKGRTDSTRRSVTGWTAEHQGRRGGSKSETQGTGQGRFSGPCTQKELME